MHDKGGHKEEEGGKKEKERKGKKHRNFSSSPFKNFEVEKIVLHPRRASEDDVIERT